MAPGWEIPSARTFLFEIAFQVPFDVYFLEWLCFRAPRCGCRATGPGIDWGNCFSHLESDTVDVV